MLATVFSKPAATRETTSICPSTMMTFFSPLSFLSFLRLLMLNSVLPFENTAVSRVLTYLANPLSSKIRPQNATTSVVYLLYKSGFINQQVGYSSAIAVVFFIIVFVISEIQNYIIGKE